MPSSPPDLSSVIDSLPRDHLVALQAALAGNRADEVAARAGVPVEAVVPLLRLATAKLEAALARTVVTPHPGAHPTGHR